MVSRIFSAITVVSIVGIFTACDGRGTDEQYDGFIQDSTYDVLFPQLDATQDSFGGIDGSNHNDTITGNDLNGAEDGTLTDGMGTPDSVDTPDGSVDDAVVGDQGHEIIEPLECGNEVLPTLAEGSCTYTAGTNYLLIQADILAPDRVLHNGHILVDPTGLIACVDCDCSGATGFSGASRLECPHGIASPALINGHDHITFDGNAPKAHGTERYNHRHEWRKGLNGKTKIPVPSTNGAVAIAELRHIVAGATSMFGSGSSSGLLRNIDVNLLGIESARLTEYETFPLGDNDGMMYTDSCDYPTVPTAEAVDGYYCYIPHVAEGVNQAARNEFTCLSSDDNGGHDILGDNVAFIHGVGVHAEDVALMGQGGTSLIWSPRSNIDLYGNTAAVTLYDKLGIEIGLGPDWTASGSMNMLRELACVDYINQSHLGGYFTDRQIVDFATKNNAKIFHLEDKLGSLKAGLLADISIFSTRESVDERAIIEAEPTDIVLVLRSGTVLYGDQALVEGLTNSDSGCENLDVCGVAKRICVQREISKTLATAQADWYDLFFCGVPPNEPSCVPYRPGEYDGVVTANDSDGDGIPNVQDNCPLIFNPVRVMDESAQSDRDNDGVGDVCDPCPLDPDTTECTTFDPDDRDGDDFPNEFDNCPADPNDQTDTDKDGKGDICDLCPEYPNPGDELCLGSVYAIKKGHVTAGSSLKIADVVVTAIVNPGSPKGFFVQVPTNSLDYDGSSYSGMYVHGSEVAPYPAIGDVVTFTATVDLYYGEWEMKYPKSMTIVSSGAPLPSAVSATPAEVATGGGLSAALEGVLVEVSNVIVTAINPPAGAGDKDPTNAFVVDNSLRVNDFLYADIDLPVVGDEFSSIVGVLRYSNDNSQLEPRGADDLVVGSTAPASLKTVAPSQVWICSAFDGPTVPPLTVTLNRTPDAPVNIAFSSTPLGVVSLVDDADSFNLSTSSVEVALDGKTLGTAPQTATVSFTLSDKTLDALVTVVDPASSPTAITPIEKVFLTLGQKTVVNLPMTYPNVGGARSYPLTCTGEHLTCPTNAELALNATTLSFEVEGISLGTGTISSQGTDWDFTFDYEVTSAPAESKLILAEIFYDHSGVDDGFEWIKLYNAGNAPVVLDGHSISVGNTSYDPDSDAYATAFDLTGSLDAGSCLLIGGPNADAENGNPVYDIAMQFTPQIQNSDGTTDKGDAAAIFNVQVSAITSETIPIDAVIFGGGNSKGFLDETGSVGTADVADAAAGKSIRRSSLTTWEVATTPTPNDCPNF